MPTRSARTRPGPDRAPAGPPSRALGHLRLVEGPAEIGYWSADLRSDAIHGSAGLYRILGIDPSRPLGFDVLREMMHPDDRGAHAKVMDALMSGEPVERDFRLIRPDRSLRWVSSRAEIAAGPESWPSLAIGVVRDITGRHGAGLGADRGHERFEALIRATAAVVWVVSPDGRALSMPQWETLTGQPTAEHQGLGWLQALHPDDRERTAEAWRTAVNHATLYNTDYRILCADGIYRWYNSRGTPILDRDGRVREWVGVLLSIPGQNRFDFGSPAFIPEQSRTAGGITPAQMRAGRGIAGLSANELARRTNLSVSTIKRMESDDSEIQSRRASFDTVRRILEESGVSFTFDPGGKPGARPA